MAWNSYICMYVYIYYILLKYLFSSPIYCLIQLYVLMSLSKTLQ